MLKNIQPNLFICFLWLLLSLNACTGQTPSPAPTDNKSKAFAQLSRDSLVKRTQSIGIYTNIDCGIQDKSGILWFGSNGDGLYRYDGKEFIQFTTKEGLSSNCVWSLLEDRSGRIWIGTSEGICRLDGETIKRIPISDLIRPITDNAYYSEWGTKKTIWSILQDKNGIMWFGAGDGVYCFDGFNFTLFLSNKQVENKENLHLKVISDMVEDAAGNIWFTSGMPPGYEGLIKYDGKALTRFRPQDEGWFRNIVKSKNGNLLLATRHYGVWSYDGNTFSDYPQPDKLIEGSLNAIWEDKTGEIWVASDYGVDKGDTLGGLWHSNFKGNPSSSAPFTKIFNKEVYFVMEDKDSNIWFSSMGMSLFRYDGKTVKLYSEN